MTTSESSAGWHPDPWGRFAQRYWDGAAWTEHVAERGEVSVDPVPDGAGALASATVSGADPILDAALLVVHRAPRVVGGDAEFAVYDAVGSQVGAIRQVAHSAARRAARVFTSADRYVTQRLQVVDMTGTMIMQLTRPATLVRSQIVVADGRGRTVGTVQQENVFGSQRFACMVGESRIGAIEPRPGTDGDVVFSDEAGTEVARVTRSFDHVVTALLGPADDVVIEVHVRLDDPLRRLVLASALSYDIAFRPGDA